MDDGFIDYGQLIDDAMHVIVKKALQKIIDEGLPGKHHFFISFVTGYPGVKISAQLLEKYPEEMTIVLQHQFSELKVTDEGFSVELSFGGKREQIYVPFGALIAFADPSVKFGLQFRHVDHSEMIDVGEDYDPDVEDNIEILSVDEAKHHSQSSKKEKKAGDKDELKKDSPKKTKGKSKNNVVNIDTFRKK